MSIKIRKQHIIQYKVILSSFNNQCTFMFIHQCDSVEKWIEQWTSSDA